MRSIYPCVCMVYSTRCCVGLQFTSNGMCSRRLWHVYTCAWRHHKNVGILPFLSFSPIPDRKSNKCSCAYTFDLSVKRSMLSVCAVGAVIFLFQVFYSLFPSLSHIHTPKIQIHRSLACASTLTWSWVHIWSCTGLYAFSCVQLFERKVWTGTVRFYGKLEKVSVITANFTGWCNAKKHRSSLDSCSDPMIRSHYALQLQLSLVLIWCVWL